MGSSSHYPDSNKTGHHLLCWMRVLQLTTNLKTKQKETHNMSLKDNRKKLLPWVTDWQNPQNHIKYKKIKSLNYNDWFWCHPSAYKLIYLGNSGLQITAGSCAAIFGIFHNSIILTLVATLLTFFFAWRLIKKINEIRIAPTTTFYDMYLRDYQTKYEN